MRLESSTNSSFNCTDCTDCKPNDKRTAPIFVSSTALPSTSPASREPSSSSLPSSSLSSTDNCEMYSPPTALSLSSSSSSSSSLNHKNENTQKISSSAAVCNKSGNENEIFKPSVQFKNSNDYPYKDANDIPVPQTFDDLVHLIRCEMGVYGLTDPEINVDRLQSIIGNYKSHPEEWSKFAFFDKYRYTRNLVDDGNGKYNLLLLCWGPGMMSPIHDHAGSHCILKVMDGKLDETLFDWPEWGQPRESEGDIDLSKLKTSRLTQMQCDMVGYMHDKIGIHRVSNVSNELPAVSLHLYSPPINSCLTFSEETGRSRKTGNCVFFSVKGEKSKFCSPGLSSPSGDDC